MAFPTTGYLDQFNRSNTGPPPSANWDYNSVDYDGLQVISNQCAPNQIDGVGYAYWKTQLGPDLEAYVTIAVISDGFPNIMLCFRDDSPNVPNAINGYQVDVDRETLPTPSAITLSKAVSGVPTALGSSSQQVNNGDSIGVSAVGSAIKVYYKAAGGSWTEIISVTDATFSGAGYIKLNLGNGDIAQRFDDFGGGTLASGRTGDLSQTLGALSLSADGWLERIGDLAQTLGALTLDAQGEAITYQYPILVNVQRITASGPGAIGVDVSGHAISQNVRADSLVVENGGILEARSVYYDTITTLGSGQIVPLRSDRAVWDVANYATRHASDIDGSTWIYHNDPARAGTYAVTNPTTDRAFDVNSTSLFEIASVLGTLLGDLGMI